MYAYGGGLKPEDRVTHGAALDPEDIQICTVGEDGTLTPVEGKVIGENGQVTLSFAAAGSYVLSAMGDELTNIFSPWLPVTVTAAPKSSNAMSAASLSRALRPLLARTTPTPLPSPTARTLQRAAS